MPSACYHVIPRASRVRWPRVLAVPLGVLVALAVFAVGPATSGASSCTDVKLKANDNLRTVTIRPCQKITISLTDCFDCGYQWKVTRAPSASVLKHVSTREVSPRGVVGGEGTFVIVYRAVRRGRANLKLGYYPPGMASREKRGFALTVKVS